MKTRLSAALVVAVLAGAAGFRASAQSFPTGEDRKAMKEKAVETLKSPTAQPFEKDVACRTLAVTGGKEEIPLLAGLLADEQLSHMARYALQAIPDPAVDAALREAAGKLKGRLLAGVILSIQTRKDAAAVPVLIPKLADADPEVVSAAAVALGTLGTPEAAKAVEGALASAKPELKAAVCDGALRVAEGLAAKGQKDAAAALFDKLRAAGMPKPIRIAAMRGAVLARGAAGASLLVEGLKGTDLDMLTASLRLAYEMPGKEVTQAMADALKDLDLPRQVRLTLALGVRGDATALPAVMALVKGGQGEARTTAIRVLPQLVDASAVPMLFDLCGDSDAEIAKIARSSLSALPGAAIDAAIVAQLKPESKYRLLAIEVAGERRSAAALPVIVKAVEDPQEPVRLAAVKALELLAGMEQVPVLTGILGRSKSPQERVSAMRGLVRLGSDASQPEEKRLALCKQALGLAQGPEEKKAVLAGLVGIASADALKVVESVTDEAVKGDAEMATLKIALAMSGSKAEESKALLEKLAASAANGDVKRQAESALRQLDKASDYVMAWQVAGPFAQGGKSNQDLFEMVFPPEKFDTKEAKDVKWRPLPAGGDPNKAMVFNLAAACGEGEQKMCYVRTWLKADKETPALVQFGTDDGGKLWVNGKQVFANPAGGAATPDKYKVEVTLKAGWNALLLKVTQDSGPWEFCLRVTNTKGMRIGTLKVQATPPE
jgi:HEAT repeat protein